MPHSTGVPLNVDTVDDFWAFLPPPKPTPTVTRYSPSKLQEADTDTFLSFLPPPEPEPLPPPLIECPVATVHVTDEHQKPFVLFTGDETRRLRMSVIREILRRGPFPLSSLPYYAFNGDGVYALYYHGSFVDYLPIRSLGATLPIYAGKAAQASRPDGTYARLTAHFNEIERARLGVENFTFRFVILPTDWVEFAERTLHEAFLPVWNYSLKGFGRGTRKGMEDQTTSMFHTYHPQEFAAQQVPRDIRQVRDELQGAITLSLQAHAKTMTALISP